MLKLLTNLFVFLTNPVESFKETLSLKMKINWITFLFLLDIPLMLVLIFLQNIPVRMGFIDSKNHRVIEMFSESSLLTLVISGIIIIPFIEELVLRLPLKIRRLHFIPLIIIFPLFYGIALTNRINNGYQWFILIPVLIAVIFFYFILNRHIFGKIKSFLKTRYKGYFYLIALTFAILHLLNYQYSRHVLMFAPLLILPQLAGGIIIGFLRIKCGFFYGYFFHVLHNTLFLLPLFFLTHSATPVVKSQINTDGFEFRLTEENLSARTKDFIVTPNEIIVQGTMLEVISKLCKTKESNILFNKNMLAYKNISLTLKSDSTWQLVKTDTISTVALQKLSETYDFKIETKNRYSMIYSLSISNQNIFQTQTSGTPDIEYADRVRTFFGKNDTIKLKQIYSKDLTRFLEINYNINTEDNINKMEPFSIIIPNKTLPQLKRYLKSNYGIKLKSRRVEKEFLIIK